MRHRPNTPRITQERINLLISRCKNQREFGDKIGSSRKRVSEMLRGESPVYAMDIKAISQEFKVSPSWLLGLDEVIYEELGGQND